jgi:hypothetical protein
MTDLTLIYLVTYNFDYEESARAFRTRAEAVADIADTFECESEPDTPAFWQEVMDTYGAGNWKGFQFLTLDPATMAIKEARTDG